MKIYVEKVIWKYKNYQDEGVMRLDNRKIHRQAGPVSGFSIWGSGN